MQRFTVRQESAVPQQELVEQPSHPMSKTGVALLGETAEDHAANTRAINTIKR